MLHYKLKNLKINKFYPWSFQALSSHTSIIQTSSNCQHSYKETIIHRDTWITNHCNRRSNMMFLQVHGSFNLLMNVELHLPKSSNIFFPTYCIHLQSYSIQPISLICSLPTFFFPKRISHIVTTLNIQLIMM
jgi:hypothetical protein